MSIKGRLERLERAVPKDETVSEISEEQGQEALALLRATIAYRGQDSYEADELRAKLGGDDFERLFGDVQHTGVAPWGPPDAQSAQDAQA